MSQIVAVLEYYGAPMVPRSHSWAKMRCPFHDDKHPSATVSQDANRFVCFACGISESAAGLVKWREGGSYADAVKRASEIAGKGSPVVQSESFGGEWFPCRKKLVGSGGVGAVEAWRSRIA